MKSTTGISNSFQGGPQFLFCSPAFFAGIEADDPTVKNGLSALNTAIDALTELTKSTPKRKAEPKPKASTSGKGPKKAKK